MKLLIVEDEKDLVSGMSRGLKKNDFEVEVAYDGIEGLRYIEENNYDCVLLDINLPGLDGLSLLKKVREKDQRTKILILSARSEVEDKVQGLNLGADDYLTKPFYFVELLARIRNLCKRQFINHGSSIVFSDLTLDPDAKIVQINNQNLDCTAREYRILECLVLHKGQYQSAEEIIDYVWQSEADYFSNALKVHLSSLRRKLLCSSQVHIACRKGIGYRLEEKE